MTLRYTGRLLMMGVVLVQVLPALAQGRAVVMISDLAGVVTLEGRKEPLGLMEEVAPDLTLHLKAGARITFVNMKTGAESSFTGPGKFKLDAHGEAKGMAAKHKRMVAALQGTVRLRPGALAQASVVMRAVPGAPEQAMSPAGPWSLSATPEFRWQAAAPKATYHFKLQDPQGQVVFELTQDDCSIQVPEHLALADETAYTWVLETTLADGAQTRRSGQIKVLPKALREQLQAGRPTLEAPFSERLVYAAVLEQHELHEEARVYWKSLAKERPEDPALAKIAGN